MQCGMGNVTTRVVKIRAQGPQGDRDLNKKEGGNAQGDVRENTEPERGVRAGGGCTTFVEEGVA